MEWSNALAGSCARGRAGPCRYFTKAPSPTPPPGSRPTVAAGGGRAKRGAVRAGASGEPLAVIDEAGRAGRADAEPLLAVAERLPRVRLLLLGREPAGLRQRRHHRPTARAPATSGWRSTASPSATCSTTARTRGCSPTTICSRTGRARCGSSSAATTTTERMPAAAELFERSAPVSPGAHLVELGERALLLVPDGSRVYDVDAETAAALDAARRDGTPRRAAVRAGAGRAGVRRRRAVSAPPVRALSLAVAQKCNLGCTYCYAQQGSFGGAAEAACRCDTALAAVDLLLARRRPGERVNLAFLGGEPLLNRARDPRGDRSARAALAAQRGATVTFSITTNGTLADARRRRLLRGARLRGHGQPRRRRRRARPRCGRSSSGRGSFDAVLRARRAAARAPAARCRSRRASR